MKIVFLIDDDPIFVYLAKKMIETIDNSVVINTFADGELAINRLNDIQHAGQPLPDVIFLDLNMPVMDGWDFLRSYTSLSQTLGKNIPVYILSSTISPDDIESSKQYTVVSDFIIKPIHKEQFAAILMD